MSEESKVRKILGRAPGVHALSGGTDRMVAAQQDRLDEHQAILQELSTAVSGMQVHLPDVLNAIASHHGAQRRLKHNIDEVQLDVQEQVDSLQEQLASHQQQIAEVHLRFDDSDTGVGPAITALWDRIELVRKELLFEMRYSGLTERDAQGSAAAAAQGPRVLDVAKMQDMAAGGLRLNLGCGHLALDGYLNVDMREIPGVDVVAEVGELPFEPGSLEEIFSAHVLEHFPLEQLRRQLLPYWVDLLRPGGTFRAVVPDAEAMVRRYHAGEMPYEQFREVFFGGQEYEGDFHFNMFTVDSLTELLDEAGLNEVVVEAQDRPNGQCFEFQVAATRSA